MKNVEFTKMPCYAASLDSTFFVIPKRFERLTHALEGRCSIQLSYGTILNCGCKGSAFCGISKRFLHFF